MHRLFIVFVLIDQITKMLLASRDFFILGLHLHPMKNFGLPFGLDFGGVWNFILLCVVYAVALWYIKHLPSKSIWMYAGKSMFLAGAASNLIDRIFFGYVRDFIDISLGFVFNVADLFIVVGLVIILLLPPDKTRTVENSHPISKT